MSEPTGPPRRPSGCALFLGCVGAAVAAALVIVHAVTTWAAGHPWTVILVAGMAAAGGTLGGWLAARTSNRKDQGNE
jgi:ABC-type sugar transport system substrate-binding protein